MEDIEAFSTTYRAWVDEAELAKIIPNDISLEVMIFPNLFYSPCCIIMRWMVPTHSFIG